MAAADRCPSCGSADLEFTEDGGVGVVVCCACDCDSTEDGRIIGPTDILSHGRVWTAQEWQQAIVDGRVN